MSEYDAHEALAQRAAVPSVRVRAPRPLPARPSPFCGLALFFGIILGGLGLAVLASSYL